MSLVLSFTWNHHAVIVSVNASTLFKNFIHRILGVGIFIYIICLPLKRVQIDWKVSEWDAANELDGDRERERGEKVAFSMPAVNNVKCGNASLFWVCVQTCGALFKLKMRHIFICNHAFQFRFENIWCREYVFRCILCSKALSGKQQIFGAASVSRWVPKRSLNG